MNIGGLLLYIGFVSTLLTTIFLFFKWIRIGLWTARIAALSTTLSLLFMAYAFVTLDFSIYYVWQFSSSSLPIFYRLASMIVGECGTYLLWAWLSTLLTFIYMENRKRRAVFDCIYAFGICTFLLFLTIIVDPFRSIFLTEGATLPTAGNAISPALMDILMPIHILTAFVAYAFALIPAASSIAYLTHGGRLDVRNQLRLSWLSLSICMVVGGIWANRMLGWNGFWQWDPIQSITLGTWLLLTAALHAAARFRRGEYQRLYPLLSIFSFIGCIQITFVARSGIYDSIHSYLHSSTTPFLIGFILIAMIASILLVFLRGEERESKPASTLSVLAPQNTFYFTILILIILAFVSFWGPNIQALLRLMGYNTVISSSFYNTFLYPLTIALAYLTGLCIVYGRARTRRIAYVTVLFIIATILFGLTIPDDAIIVLPPALFILGNVLFKMIRDLRLKSRVASLHLTGIDLIHLGFGLVLLGSVIASSFAVTSSFSYSFEDEGVYKEVDGVGVKLLDFRVEKIGSDWLQIVDLELFYGDIRESMTATYMKSRQFGFISRPAVRYGMLSNIIVDMEGMLPCRLETGGVELVVRRYPLLNLLWIGCVFLIGGLLLTLAAEFMHKRRR